MAADILLEGGIVAYPTDTLYGLAVDPLQDAAVARLYEAKGRDAGIGIPLIAARSLRPGSSAVFRGPDMVLARAFWPGPLTLVLRSRDRLSQRISSGGRTIAIRVPAHPVATSLADRFGVLYHGDEREPVGAACGCVCRRGGRDTLVGDRSAPRRRPSPWRTAVDDRRGARKTDRALVRAGSIAWERVLRSLDDADGSGNARRWWRLVSGPSRTIRSRTFPRRARRSRQRCRRVGRPQRAAGSAQAGSRDVPRQRESRNARGFVRREPRRMSSSSTTSLRRPSCGTSRQRSNARSSIARS